jgi:hypothetical protein
VLDRAPDHRTGGHITANDLKMLLGEPRLRSSVLLAKLIQVEVHAEGTFSLTGLCSSHRRANRNPEKPIEDLGNNVAPPATNTRRYCKRLEIRTPKNGESKISILITVLSICSFLSELDSSFCECGKDLELHRSTSKSPVFQKCLRRKPTYKQKY